MKPEEIEEMKRLAGEAIKGSPLYCPTRRERELGRFLLTMLLKIEDADKMAAAVDVMIRRNALDPRSLVADRRLDYGQPFDEATALRLAFR